MEFNQNSNGTYSPDVAVIGGGPVGCVTALAFARKGARVLLLEGNPRTLPQEHGKSTLEELFIAVAREPLSLES